MTLELVDPDTGKPLRNLKLVDLGGGTFVAIEDAKTLEPGVYDIRLSYERRELSLEYPYLSTSVSREKRFLVVD